MAAPKSRTGGQGWSFRCCAPKERAKFIFAGLDRQSVQRCQRRVVSASGVSLDLSPAGASGSGALAVQVWGAVQRATVALSHYCTVARALCNDRVDVDCGFLPVSSFRTRSGQSK